ncbi:hypothetical protein [Brevibacterium moorei]|uniref:hypothetical protein n=1 Tax=Brevibacterium moorei TaxID=2968457 RepID=UPI00211BBF05|nr:hypothetical protein [Brevibacterium sp. 68QC2CO]MCQ9385157.1 hypothetical protein [Brevibacterium sp. 68QC2CO]
MKCMYCEKDADRWTIQGPDGLAVGRLCYEHGAELKEIYSRLRTDSKEAALRNVAPKASDGNSPRKRARRSDAAIITIDPDDYLKG